MRSASGGKGVRKAVDHVNGALRNLVVGLDPADQAGLDAKLIAADGTDNKSKLGANAILAVSLAAAHAAARDRKMPLYRHLSGGASDFVMPAPMMNIINGGAHADNSVDIQEFMILPLGAPSLAEAVRYGAEVFHSLKKVLHAKGLNTAVGDEGGFAPDLPSNEAALTTILEAIDKAGYRAGRDVYLGLDVASNELYKDGVYDLASEGRKFSSSEFADYLASLAAKYPIVTIEDGMSESDWDGWSVLTQKLGSKLQLVGDDIFVTNTKIFAQGIAKKIANAILIKPNQIGTLTETLAAIDMAAKAKYAADHLASLGGDRGCDHRGYCGGHVGDPDQDRVDVAFGPNCQVQPAVADRGGARRQGVLRRAQCTFGSSFLRTHAKLLSS